MDKINWTKIIAYIGYFVLFINLILYAKSYRKKSKAFHILISYLVVTFVIQLITNHYANERKNNLFLSHYYFIGQFLLLSWFYYLILERKVYLKIIKIIASIVLIALSIQFFVHPKTYWKFSLLEVVICSIPLVLYALFYFYESFGVKHKKYLYFNSGVFFYLLSSTLIFSTGNYLVATKPKLAYLIYDLNAYLYVVFLIFIFIEWYQNFRKKKTVSSDAIDTFLE